MKTTLFFFLSAFVIVLISQKSKAQSFVSIVAGNGIGGFSGDSGSAIAASFSHTQGVCFDGFGNLYIVDQQNARIRKVDPAGIVTTVVGNGMGGYSGDSGLAIVAGISAYGVSCDANGNLLIGDWANNRVRRVDAATGIITTVAGNGHQLLPPGDGGLAVDATVFRPIYACLDAFNNIIISEYQNHKIRKVDAGTGIITTIAGNGNMGFSGDWAPAINAGIGNPVQLAVDKGNNIFFADQISGRIRKIDTSGIITTIAGGGTSIGSGIPATDVSLSGTEGIVVDCFGNIFIADNDNNVIRKVDATTGIITTIAGGGIDTVTFGGIPALTANFHNQLLCLDLSGNLYCSTDAAPYVYKITNVSDCPLSAPSNIESIVFKIYPNPVNSILHITSPVRVRAIITGFEGKILVNQSDAYEIPINYLSNGLYFITLYDADGKLLKVDKLIKN